MSTAQINYVNIFLMLGSLAAAMMLPFEVFLFSYAVLGPLHYLTEISWLHDRQFFTQRKWDWTVLAALTLLSVAGSKYLLGDYAISWLSGYQSDILFAAFASALVFAVVQSTWKRIVSLLGVLFLIDALHGSSSEEVIFVLYVPTLIHVFVFTGAFILYGSLKSKGASGYVSLVVFLICAAVTLMVRTTPSEYFVSDYVKNAYQPFVQLNRHFIELLGFGPILKGEVFTSTISVRVMRFIAWAYTYHYLNWFSKTSIIGWHNVSKRRIAFVLILWCASIVLYGIDYALGFKWLLLLSLAHVLLEFPLNHQSFLGIGREITGRFQTLRGAIAGPKE